MHDIDLSAPSALEFITLDKAKNMRSAHRLFH